MKRRIVPLAVLSSFVLISSIRSSPNSQNGPQADAAPRSKWTTTEIPVHVLHLDTPHWALASAQGYWQSTSSDADKQLVNPIAVKEAPGNRPLSQDAAAMARLRAELEKTRLDFVEVDLDTAKTFIDLARMDFRSGETEYAFRL